MTAALLHIFLPPSTANEEKILSISYKLDFLIALTVLVIGILGAFTSVIGLSAPLSYLLIGSGGLVIFYDLCGLIHDCRAGDNS